MFIKVKLLAPTDQENVSKELEGLLNIANIISAADMPTDGDDKRPRFGVKMNNGDFFILVKPEWAEFVKALGALPWNEIH